MKKLKLNGYASIVKRAWNDSCWCINEINKSVEKFRKDIRKLNSLDIKSKEEYRDKFCKYVNKNLSHLVSRNFKCKDFSECSVVFKNIKMKRGRYITACKRLKSEYYIACLRYKPSTKA